MNAFPSPVVVAKVTIRFVSEKVKTVDNRVNAGTSLCATHLAARLPLMELSVHRDERADRDLEEELAGSLRRQPDAAVRCGIIRHHPGMHSEIEATKPHEIGHVHFVDRGTMVPLFIGNDKATGACGVPLPPSRTFRAKYRHAVFNESGALRSERDFDAQLIRGRPTAEKDLCASPLPGLGSNV